MLRASGAGPLESGWPTPSLSVPDHSQFPLEIYLLTPPPSVFQDAAVSIRLVTQYLPENKAKLRGVFVERGHRNCSSSRNQAITAGTS